MASTKNRYLLPMRKKDLSMAISDPRTHFAHGKHSIDFLLPIGTKILAARAGHVVEVKVDSNKGGFDPKYKGIKYLNYLTIHHDNGEFSQYLHLKYKGSLVKVGAKVKEGQPIALSGNTGYTTAPHLHFHVLRLVKTKVGWETLKIRFKEKIDVYMPKKK